MITVTWYLYRVIFMKYLNFLLNLVSINIQAGG